MLKKIIKNEDIVQKQMNKLGCEVESAHSRLQHFVHLFSGYDRLSMDRCHYGSAEKRRLDPPLGQACCGLFLDQGRPLDIMGGRHEGSARKKQTI